MQSIALDAAGHHRSPVAMPGYPRQLGHANLGITSIYLQGIDSSEIIATVRSRPGPTISATAGLTAP